MLLVGLGAAHRAVFAHWCLERGLRALVCKSASQALDAARSSSVRAVLASVEGRAGPATRLCEKLRQRGFVGPLMCISRLGGLDLETAVLRAGADDFVAHEPVQRLLARANALLRRAAGTYARTQAYGSLVIDHARRDASVLGRAVSLTPTEFEILSYFAANRGRVVSTDEIAREVLGARRGRRNVKRHVSRVRHKLGSARGAVKTVRFGGYFLRAREVAGCELALAASGRHPSGGAALADRVLAARDSGDVGAARGGAGTRRVGRRARRRRGGSG